MNYMFFLFLIISNPLYAENIPGEWIGESALQESPVSNGNVFANPATADSLNSISVSARFSSDDYNKFDAKLSSVIVTFPVIYDFLIGGRINLLYNSQLEGKFPCSNEWGSYVEYFERRGGLDQYSLFLKKTFGEFSLGFDLNLQNGELEDRWKIDFAEYSDIFDTLSTYFRGYSAGVGLLYYWKGFKVGGYYSFYQNLEFWRDGEDREVFNLEKPVRFGISYSLDRGKSVMLSADRKLALLTGRYGPLMIGYGRIYGSGYNLNIDGNRFIVGMFLSLNRVPFTIAIENRRYSGELRDNEYIGTITISISGSEGGK